MSSCSQLTTGILLVFVLLAAWYWWYTRESMESSHGVKCINRAFAGGPGYRATCSRGHYLPTSYHVDTRWNSDVSTSKNMNYAYSYWNGIKLASCDECPTPYQCQECPKFTGAGEGYFDDPNKIRGINENINIGEDEKAPTVHGEFFGPGPVFTDNAPLVPPKTPIDDISVLASNAYEIARRTREEQDRVRRGSSSIRADSMVGDRAPDFNLVSPAPLHFTADRANFNLVSPAPMHFTVVPESMSVSSHDEVYHGHNGEFVGESMCGSSPTNTDRNCQRDPEDLYYTYMQDYAADSISEISRELHAKPLAKPRAASRIAHIAADSSDSTSSDTAALVLRKHVSTIHAPTAGCRSSSTTATKLLYNGVLGLHNPVPDLGQCEYLRSNGYVYQEPCEFSD